MIHIPYPSANPYYPSTWGYMHLKYSSYQDNKFYLEEPIPRLYMDFFPDDPTDPDIVWPCLQLGNNDEVWVDLPDPMQVCLVDIREIKEGWPIRQIAFPTEKITQVPDWSNQGDTFDVGMVLPGESFFVWVQRIVTSESGCCDGFTLSLTGDSA